MIINQKDYYCATPNDCIHNHEGCENCENGMLAELYDKYVNEYLKIDKNKKGV